MKNLILAGVMLLAASSLWADPPKKTGFTATNRPSRNTALHPPPVTPGPESRGVLTRAFQSGGNPVQMLNPRAPAQYGTAAQSLAIDPDTGKWNGIKLFEIIF